jgi:hypothetical protein
MLVCLTALQMRSNAPWLWCDHTSTVWCVLSHSLLQRMGAKLKLLGTVLSKVQKYFLWQEQHNSWVVSWNAISVWAYWLALFRSSTPFHFSQTQTQTAARVFALRIADWSYCNDELQVTTLVLVGSFAWWNQNAKRIAIHHFTSARCAALALRNYFCYCTPCKKINAYVPFL